MITQPSGPVARQYSGVYSVPWFETQCPAAEQRPVDDMVRWSTGRTRPPRTVVCGNKSVWWTQLVRGRGPVFALGGGRAHVVEADGVVVWDFEPTGSWTTQGMDGG